MFEIMFLLIPFYGLIWFTSLFMMLSKDKIMHRIYQILHIFYLIIVTYFLYDSNELDSVLTAFFGLQLASSLFVTYRFVKCRKEDPDDDEKIPFEEQLTPEIRKNIKQFRKTMDSVFNINSQTNNQ